MEREKLRHWYSQNHRPLPWRENRDPYRIWISETMLQQTTSTAVIPYYEKFIARFPNLRSLATAQVEDVLQHWAGLGYYSRARNLHRAAQDIWMLGEFPRSVNELLELPGFGPYTARAVASLAFDASVGVVDGNVIRVLTRYNNWRAQWWKSSVKEKLQEEADKWVESVPSHEVNQALMELGATICTPRNPSCWLCPIRVKCQSRIKGTVSTLPLRRPRKPKMLVLWTVQILTSGSRIALVQNSDLPFLRNQWVPPGPIKTITCRPKNFDFRHHITHYEIYIKIRRVKSVARAKWILKKDVSRFAPTSIVRKILETV